MASEDEFIAPIEADTLRFLEDDLSWYYLGGGEPLGGQNIEVSGGKRSFHNGNVLARDGGLFTPCPATQRAMAIMDPRSQREHARRARIHETLNDVGADTRTTLRLAYGPSRGVDDWMRDLFARRIVEIVVTKNNRTVYKRDKDGLETIEALTTKMTSVSLVELAIETDAIRRAYYKRERGQGRFANPPTRLELLTFIRDEAGVRRHDAIGLAKAEARNRLDVALAAYREAWGRTLGRVVRERDERQRMRQAKIAALLGAA
jgi:hypothetical protein